MNAPGAGDPIPELISLDQLPPLPQSPGGEEGA